MNEQVASTEPETEPGQVDAEPRPGSSQEGDSSETLAVPLASLKPALEALLMIADEPMGSTTLASAVGYATGDVEAALVELVAEYDRQGRGFELRSVAGGWRFYTRSEFASIVEAFVLDGQQARLTQAALETLAVVAYRQPISRSRVSAIRGVNVDGVMRTLLTRGLVEESGTDEETGAHLYQTTSYFLERIGIQSLDELPELAPFLPGMDDLELPEADAAAPAEGGSVAGMASVDTSSSPPAASTVDE